MLDRRRTPPHRRRGGFETPPTDVDAASRSSRCASMTLAGGLLVVERIGSPAREFGVAQHVPASSRCLQNLAGPATAPRLTLPDRCLVTAADACQAARLFRRRVPR